MCCSDSAMNARRASADEYTAPMSGRSVQESRSRKKNARAEAPGRVRLLRTAATRRDHLNCGVENACASLVGSRSRSMDAQESSLRRHRPARAPQQGGPGRVRRPSARARCDAPTDRTMIANADVRDRERQIRSEGYVQDERHGLRKGCKHDDRRTANANGRSCVFAAVRTFLIE